MSLLQYVNKQEYNLSFMQENVELVIYSMICFFVPFLVAHPQFLVGTIVNTALVLAAFNLKGIKILPVVLLPSLGVLSRGFIFGTFTPTLAYVIPFIWLGNFAFVYGIKALSEKTNIISSITISAVLKTSLIFLGAFLLFKSAILPAAILGAMGLMQLYTAITGGVIALIIQKAKKNFN